MSQPTPLSILRTGELRRLQKHGWLGVLQLAVFVLSMLLPMQSAHSDYFGDLDNDGIPEQHADDDGQDTDNDGLKDGFEIYVSGTDPLNWDSNSDGYSDGDEYHQNYGVNYWYSTAMNVQGTVTFADFDGDAVVNWLDSWPVDGLNGMGDRDSDGIWDMFDAYPDDYYNGDPWMGQPHFNYNGTEYYGSWMDTDTDGIPDAADSYPYDYNNGIPPGPPLTSSFSGNYWINGLYTSMSGSYSSGETDSDSDGIPDSFDPYPYDSTNDTSYWGGGQYDVDGVNTSLSGGYYSTSQPLTDSDSDGIFDIFDPYTSDSTNNTSYWNGQYYVDGMNTYLSGAYSSSQSLTDTDNDGIFDLFDPYSDDATNNTSYIGGQYYAGRAFDGVHPEATAAWLADWFAHPENRTAAPLYLSLTNLADTDGDTIPDEIEDFFGLNKQDVTDAFMVQEGSAYTNLERYLGWQDLRDPFDPWQYGQADSIPNMWKARYGFNMQDPGLFLQDTDTDGLDNLSEYGQGTNPLLADTDEDGESDGAEVTQGSSPTDANSNSTNLDSDGDGYSDAAEIAAGTDPLNPNSSPTDGTANTPLIIQLVGRSSAVYGGYSPGSPGGSNTEPVEIMDGEIISRTGALDLVEYDSYLAQSDGQSGYKSLSKEPREVIDGVDEEGNNITHTVYDWSVQHYHMENVTTEIQGGPPQYQDYLAINPALYPDGPHVIESEQAIRDKIPQPPTHTTPIGLYLLMPEPTTAAMESLEGTEAWVPPSATGGGYPQARWTQQWLWANKVVDHDVTQTVMLTFTDEALHVPGMQHVGMATFTIKKGKRVSSEVVLGGDTLHAVVVGGTLVRNPIITVDGQSGQGSPLTPVEVRDGDRALTSLPLNEDPWTNANLQKQVADSSIAWITGNTGFADTPEMPKLNARIPGAPSSLNVRWRFECEYKRGNGYRANYVADFTKPEDKVGVPYRHGNGYTEEMPASQEWKIYETEKWQQELQDYGFFGGLAKVFMKLENQPEMEVCRFRIGGKNPDQDAAKNYINSHAGSTFWYAYAIAKHETFGRVPGRFYNHFYTDHQPAGGHIGDNANDMGWAAWTKSWPLYNLDRSYSSSSGYRQNGPGGYGLFQVTLGPKTPSGDETYEGFIERKQIWNWQENCNRAIGELQGKLPKAQALQNGLTSTYPAWGTLPNTGRLSGLDAITVTYYNGMFGGQLKNVNIDRRSVKTCWWPEQAGSGSKTWRFLQNINDYVQQVNSHIE